MITVALPADLEFRLNEAASRAGRTQAAWVLQAIRDQLEDDEDYEEAAAASQNQGKSVSSEEVKRELNL